jgi:hypothetical protein
MPLIIWNFIKKIPIQVWLLLALLIWVVWWGNSRYDAGYAEAVSEYQEQRELNRIAKEKARKELEEKYNKQAEALIKEREKEYAKRDKVIADWQSGRLRLKPRFTPTTCPSSGDNAGTEAGLLGEDVQFLIREATRADAIVRQLSACQGLIKDDQTTSQ